MPRVTIGLPVYNGARYLEASIESLLRQTWQDFELIIADNGSTDATERICRRFAEQDPRVRYERSPVNRGAAWNFNRLVPLARGEYFTWAAHDDVRAPQALEQCVRALDGNSSVVLAYTHGHFINEAGEQFREFYREPELMDSSAKERLRRWLMEEHVPYHAFFGLIRTGTLRRTPLMANCGANDDILLTHLIMLGKFQLISEPLFLNRDHERRASRSQTGEDLAVWNDPGNRGKKPKPVARRMVRQFAAACTAPMSLRERMGCLWLVLRWTGWRSRAVLEEMSALGRS